MKMVAGEQRRTWMPRIESVTDTELLADLRPSATPADVAAPPADAIRPHRAWRTRSSARGKGSMHPKHGDRVLVSYTGWTADGTIFDSSVMRGDPRSSFRSTAASRVDGRRFSS